MFRVPACCVQIASSHPARPGPSRSPTSRGSPLRSNQSVWFDSAQHRHGLFCAGSVCAGSISRAVCTGSTPGQSSQSARGALCKIAVDFTSILGTQSYSAVAITETGSRNLGRLYRAVRLLGLARCGSIRGVGVVVAQQVCRGSPSRRPQSLVLLYLRQPGDNVRGRRSKRPRPSTAKGENAFG